MLVYISLLLLFLGLQHCQANGDGGMRRQLNLITENYLRLDQKLEALTNENILLKRRLNDMEMVADQVKGLSEENIRLNNRIMKIEKLDDKFEDLTKTNNILSREVDKLGDICYGLGHIWTKQSVEKGLDGGENRKRRDMEDSIPDHTNFEQHTQSKAANFKDRGNKFREGMDNEDSLPGHQQEQNKLSVDLSETEISNKYSYDNADFLQKRGTVNQAALRLTTKVAFSVYLTTVLTLGSHQAVEYDGVLTNIGQGYDPRHGHFIAPVKAVYLLSYTLLNIEHSYVYLQLVKNGVGIGILYADDNDYNSATQVIVIALNVGDMVWVRNARTTTGHKLDEYYNTFSGTILFEI